MSRILITGGTGTFGHAATARFLAEGYTVTIFSRDEQKQELMGVCSATAVGSDPTEAEAASAPPANMAASEGSETGP